MPPIALKQPQQQAAVGGAYARTRGQMGMAAGETALIIQNKGGWIGFQLGDCGGALVGCLRSGMASFIHSFIHTCTHVYAVVGGSSVGLSAYTRYTHTHTLAYDNQSISLPTNQSMHQSLHQSTNQSHTKKAAGTGRSASTSPSSWRPKGSR